MKQPEPHGAWGGIDAYLQRNHMARMAKWLTQVSCQVLRDMNEILVDFNQASKKKRVTFASKCSTLLRHPGKSLHESASYSHSIHRIAPMHQDLNKYVLPSENTQSTPVHQTLEAHVTCHMLHPKFHKCTTCRTLWYPLLKAAALWRRGS